MENQISFATGVDQTADSAINISPTTQPEPTIQTVAPSTANVNIYAESISLSNNECNGSAIFDIVLNVSWYNENNYLTAKVVKTISFDKAKLVEQATCGTQVTVVEQKLNEEKVNAERKRKLKQMCELAGIATSGTFV